jgi:hypothetical protein
MMEEYANVEPVVSKPVDQPVEQTAEQTAEQAAKEKKARELKTSEELDKSLEEMNKALAGRLEGNLTVTDGYWAARAAYHKALADNGGEHISVKARKERAEAEVKTKEAKAEAAKVEAEAARAEAEAARAKAEAKPDNELPSSPRPDQGLPPEGFPGSPSQRPEVNPLQGIQ